MRIWTTDVNQLECRVHGMLPATDVFVYDTVTLTNLLTIHPDAELVVVASDGSKMTGYDTTERHTAVDCQVSGCPSKHAPAANPNLALRPHERLHLQNR